MVGPNTTVREFRKAIEAALERSDWGPFDTWSYEECTYTNLEVHPENLPFDSDTFDDIVRLLGEPRFQALDGTHRVLMVLENEWSRFSKAQTDTMLPVITDVYDKFADPLCWFVIAELLGEYYADQTAFAALCKINRLAVGRHRELLPMGFQYLVQHAAAASVRDAAASEVAALGLDESARVRHEVDISHGRMRAAEMRAIGLADIDEGVLKAAAIDFAAMMEGLRAECANHCEPGVFDELTTYTEFNDYGVALGVLRDILQENSLPISESVHEQIRKLAQVLDLGDGLWTSLRGLVV